MTRRFLMWRSVLLAVLVLIPVSFAHAQIPSIERDALIALYNSTDGVNWSHNTNWLGAEGTECTWYGVTCDGGHVQGLSLAWNNLSGVIPLELGNLSSLETLSLHSNQLSGIIPAELGNLSGLLDLILGSNQLNGSIPAELGNLLSLEALSLDQNQLSGSIPPELGDLSNLTGLFLSSNQLSGSIPPELGNLSSLEALSLSSNQLSGSIPSELGNLASLGELYLSSNQLSGSIPPELGNLSTLTRLWLYSNQLSGGIPHELGNLSSLLWLWLSYNQLDGSIPTELGNLSSLETLYLHSNQLSGAIPPELGNLSSLTTLLLDSNQLSGDIPLELGNLPLRFAGLDLRWNALHSDNATLVAFLNTKQWGGDWQSTQTIAPENLTVGLVGDHTVWLSWDAVSYQSDPGGYEVFSAPTVSDNWTSGGWTEAKTVTTFPVTGLDPATTYDLAVVTYTEPHFHNLNLVNSDFSPEVMATTASVGCAQPIIKIAWGDPVSLSVLGVYDSYLWSTGETTSSIDISPTVEQWYWVTVTSPGPCEETAAIVELAKIFADGFETGDTSVWSTWMPEP